MQDLFTSRLERSRKAIKNWWLMLLLGIVVFVFGLVVFVRPVESYLALSVAFGFLMLVAGAVNIALAFSTDNVLVGKGWLFATGVIEAILGIILMLHVEVSMLTLPFFLGFWLMVRSFMLIGTGSDMMSAKVKGGGWTVLLGVLLLLCSVMIFVQPLWFGAGAVLIWVGTSFLVAGVAMSMIAFQLRRLHRHFR